MFLEALPWNLYRRRILRETLTNMVRFRQEAAVRSAYPRLKRFSSSFHVAQLLPWSSRVKLLKAWANKFNTFHCWRLFCRVYDLHRHYLQAGNLSQVRLVRTCMHIVHGVRTPQDVRVKLDKLDSPHGHNRPDLRLAIRLAWSDEALPTRHLQSYLLKWIYSSEFHWTHWVLHT